MSPNLSDACRPGNVSLPSFTARRTDVPTWPGQRSASGLRGLLMSGFPVLPLPCPSHPHPACGPFLWVLPLLPLLTTMAGVRLPSLLFRMMAVTSSWSRCLHAWNNALLSWRASSKTQVPACHSPTQILHWFFAARVITFRVTLMAFEAITPSP